ncbi:MAG TPA: hypothetical protein VJT14_00240 [Candidatus Dormibacteraeota bacterium]|nr:hypothetical protein [Candidatus Dormibacteraeota bacterium]
MAVIASGFAILAAGPVAADTADITFASPEAGSITEPGVAPENAIVGGFTDPDNVALASPSNLTATCGNAAVYTAKIDWGDHTTPTVGTVSCNTETTLDAEYAVKSPDGHTYKDSGTYTVTLSVTDNADAATGDTDSAPTVALTIDDASLSATSGTSLRGGGEGGNVEPATVTASAFFSDSNTVFANAETVDPGLTATINWGDGSTSAATHISWPDCSQCGNVEVSGSHVYDANIPATKKYLVSITLHDDGGKSATSEAGSTPAIADAALTADANKTLTATATTPSTAVIGSFKDAAGGQAKAADFTASINWGDAATSAGTVTQTASGAFSVSGSHTYAAAGSKAITVTVTDEEGSTVTLHATVTVAPLVLPATGQPHPTQPAVPVIPLALLILGLASLAAGGRILAKMPR